MPRPLNHPRFSGRANHGRVDAILGGADALTVSYTAVPFGGGPPATHNLTESLLLPNGQLPHHSYTTRPCERCCWPASSASTDSRGPAHACCAG